MILVLEGILITCLDHKITLKITTIKLHNTLALPVLLYGSETGTVKASDARRITAAEMKYMRRTAGYTWDRLQNKCTNCKGVKNNTNFGQITGIQHINRMPRNRLPRVMKHYCPMGRRNHGRPLKRLLDT